MNVADLVEIKRIFDTFDKNKNGMLDLSEFEQVVTHVLYTQIHNDDLEFVKRRAQNLCARNWKMLDGLGGEIDFPTFVSWYSTTSFDEELVLTSYEKGLREIAKLYDVEPRLVDKATECFHAYDTDNSGCVEYNEFAGVLHKVFQVPADSELPEGRVRAFWRQIDTDDDGSVGLEEFLVWWLENFCAKGATSTPLEDYYASQRDMSKMDPPVRAVKWLREELDGLR